MEVKRCPLCKKPLPSPILAHKGKFLQISGDVAFHLYDTHGIHPDILVRTLNNIWGGKM